METTIPKQLYVTIQFRGDVNNHDGGLLGFASPYTKDAAFRKRKTSQDSWAYGYATVNIDEDDNITVETPEGGSSRGGYGGGQKWDSAMLFMANCHPRILENVPTEGFQIGRAVRRYGWGGGGNVKWRISDPRGFELEISSENFASVLSCCTMEKGVIKEKCVWGRLGKDNILLPESSEPYQEAVKETIKANSKVSLKEITPGDTIEIKSANVPKNDHVCEFLGKYWILTLSGESVSEREGYTRHTGKNVFNNTQLERYLIRGKDSGKVYSLASIKVSRIVEKAITPRDRYEIAKQLSQEMQDKKDKVIDEYYAILASPTKVNPDEVKTELVLATFKYTLGMDWPKVDGYHKKAFAVKQGDSWFIPHIAHSYNSPEVLALTPVTFGPNNNWMQREQTVVKSSNHYSWHYRYCDTYSDKVVPPNDPEKLEFYHIRVTFNGITGEIRTL